MAESTNKNAALQTRQYEFAAHLRDPDRNPAPDSIEDRRMAIYRNLFINNVTSLLSGNFPVLSKLMGKQRWKMLVRDFYRDHNCHTPLFPEIPKEFLDYLSNERPVKHHTDPLDDPPFMFELAHYEWVETGLALAEEKDHDPALNPDGDLLRDHPVVSELAWLISYSFPVNEIGLDNQPQQPADQLLHYIIFRDDAFKIHFLKINIVSARLFELLEADTAISGLQALRQIATELQHSEPETVMQAGTQMLEQWRRKGIVTGTLPAKQMAKP